MNDYRFSFAKYVVVLILSFLVSGCSSTVQNNSATIITRDSVSDSLAKKESDDWKYLVTDSLAATDTSVAFYFCEWFSVKVPRGYKIQYASGPDFGVYRVITNRDTFGYFLGQFPDLHYPLDFLTETNPDIRSILLKVNLNLIPPGKHHYSREVIVTDYRDTARSPGNKKMCFEIIDEKTRRLWILKPLSFDKHQVDIAVEYKNKKVDRVSHIFGSYRDSLSYNEMLQLARSITPRKFK